MPVRQGSWPRFRHSLVRCCTAVRAHDHRLAAQPCTPIVFDDLGLLVVRQVHAHSCDFFELGIRLANMSSLFGRSVANISTSPAVPRPAFSPPTAVLRCIISKVQTSLKNYTRSSNHHFDIEGSMGSSYFDIKCHLRYRTQHINVFRRRTRHSQCELLPVTDDAAPAANLTNPPSIRNTLGT